MCHTLWMVGWNGTVSDETSMLHFNRITSDYCRWQTSQVFSAGDILSGRNRSELEFLNKFQRGFIDHLPFGVTADHMTLEAWGSPTNDHTTQHRIRPYPSSSSASRIRQTPCFYLITAFHTTHTLAQLCIWFESNKVTCKTLDIQRLDNWTNDLKRVW